MIIDLYDWGPANRLTRPCSFCLSLQGGSVFADFGVDADNRVELIRISFDSFGCYRNNGDVSLMNTDDSLKMIEHVKQEAVDCDDVRDILYRFFEQNQNAIWKDTIVEHQLRKQR